jgi:Synaptobrevin
VGVQVDDVKGVMVKNVQTVVDRGERLEVMVGKAEDLSCEVTGCCSTCDTIPPPLSTVCELHVSCV